MLTFVFGAIVAWSAVCLARHAEPGECSSMLHLRKFDNVDGADDTANDTDFEAAFTRLCSVSPEEDAQVAAMLSNVTDMLTNVAKAVWSQSAVKAFSAFQADVLKNLEQAKAPDQRKLRVLIASPVSVGMLETVAYNIMKLRGNRAGDEFKLALFHYDSPTGQAPTMPADIEKALRPHVVHEHAGPGCKVEFWQQLVPDAVASNYDYLWLVDGDLRMDYLDWDLYRHILLDADPMISQPAILGWVQGRPGTVWGQLKMNVSKIEKKDYYRAIDVIEQQAPMFSSKVWPVVHARAMGINATSDCAIRHVWDWIGTRYEALNCSKAGMVVVDVCPLRHAQCRDLGYGKEERCGRHVYKEDLYEFTDNELELLARGVGETCAAGRDVEVWKLKK